MDRIKLVGALERGRGKVYIPSPLTTTKGCAMAGKKKSGKEIYFLVCKETKEQNYTVVLDKTSKSKVFTKYCPRLRRHTEHTPKKV
jgi:ribosomal protein L33